MTEERELYLGVSEAKPEGQLAPTAPSAPRKRQSLIERMAARFHVEPTKMMSTLKATAFRQSGGDRDQVTNEQMMALLVVADQYNLNPWTREIYAFPDRNKGIVPIVGVDGWNRIINSHPQFDGLEFRMPDIVTQPDHWQVWQGLDGAKTAPDWIECVIYRKDREHPTVIREYLDECYRPPMTTSRGKINGPWQSHTKRFFRHKVLIQCSRVAFSFVGVYDEDEAERIIEGEIVDTGTTTAEATAAVDELRERLDEMQRARAESAQEAPEPTDAGEDTSGEGAESPEGAAVPGEPSLERLLAWASEAPDSSALAGVMAQAGHLDAPELKKLADAVNAKDRELRGEPPEEKPKRGRAKGESTGGDS